MQVHTIAVAIGSTLRAHTGTASKSMVSDHSPLVLPPVLAAVSFVPAGSMGALSRFSLTIIPDLGDAEVAGRQVVVNFKANARNDIALGSTSDGKCDESIAPVILSDDPAAQYCPVPVIQPHCCCLEIWQVWCGQCHTFDWAMKGPAPVAIVVAFRRRCVEGVV